MGILRLLFYAALIWLLYRLIKGLKGPRVAGRRTADGGTAHLRGGDLVQDPQCGVYIPKETALQGRGGDYFCSPQCRDAHDQAGRS